MITTDSIGGEDRRESTLALHRENLKAAIAALGIDDTFKYCLDQALDTAAPTKEEAASYAHLRFLFAQQEWMKYE